MKKTSEVRVLGMVQSQPDSTVTPPAFPHLHLVGNERCGAFGGGTKGAV